MHEGVTISHRGSVYAIGRGPGFYGIWFAGAPHAQPVEWWPETPEGWQSAWSRFTGIETSGAIAAIDAQPAPVAEVPWPARVPTSKAGRLAAPALLALGVALGVAGLFPSYLGGPSLAAQPEQLVPHASYLAAWALSAALLLLPAARPRVGALIGLGTSAVTFGLLAADLGFVLAHAGSAGTGLILSLVSWLACTGGSAAGIALWRAGGPVRPRGRESGLAVALTVAAGLGAAIAFAPSWDSYTLRSALSLTQTITAGNAFANPAPVIAGDVLVMVALVIVALIAAVWRPVAGGAALLAGAVVPMAAQGISALVQIGETTSPLQFGISPAQAAEIRLTITAGLTPAYWVYCAFVIALALLCARMVTTPAPAPVAPAGPARPATSDSTDIPPASVTVS